MYFFFLYLCTLFVVFDRQKKQTKIFCYNEKNLFCYYRGSFVLRVRLPIRQSLLTPAELPHRGISLFMDLTPTPRPALRRWGRKLSTWLTNSKVSL